MILQPRSTAALLAVCLPLAEGHGSLVIPQVRNSIDRLAPEWKGGYPKIPDFPGTGRWGMPNETCGTVPWSCQEGCVGAALAAAQLMRPVWFTSHHHFAHAQMFVLEWN